MLVYGLSSSGMTISLHYCCGKIDGVSFTGVHERSCEMGNDLKKSGCCNDKQISASISSEPQAVFEGVYVAKQPIAAPFYPYINTSFRGAIVSSDKLARGTPLSNSSVPLFIKHCAYRI